MIEDHVIFSQIQFYLVLLVLLVLLMLVLVLQLLLPLAQLVLPGAGISTQHVQHYQWRDV